MFERTNENEDEEKVCEKERARRRLLLEEESSSSSSAAKVAFAFLSPKSSSSSLGKTEEEKVVETIAFFSNSRVPLTVCEEILSLFKKKNKKFEKIGHVKVSGVSERNDCLSDDFDDDGVPDNVVPSKDNQLGFVVAVTVTLSPVSTSDVVTV